MKIGYRALAGYTSTAYLDCSHDDRQFTCGHGTDEPHPGTDKYTDEPVAVLWNDTEWAEVETTCSPSPETSSDGPEEDYAHPGTAPKPSPSPTRTQPRRTTRRQRRNRR